MYRLFAQSHKLPLKLIPLALIVVLVATTIGPGEARADPGWYNSSWDYRKKITINSANVSGSDNLLYFPVLISVNTDSDLANNARNDGWDILFTASDETTKLQHEIESFNGTTGNLKAWVEIPSLSPSTDTEIYMYYGNSGVSSTSENATGVWDNADYKMVQHLEESSGGSNAITDSTSYDNDGTDDNTLTYAATGQMDGAIGFNGSDDYINCGNDSSLDITSTITIEVWVKEDTSPAVSGTIVSKPSSSAWTDPYADWILRARDDEDIEFWINSYNNVITASDKIVLGDWTYLVATYNGTAQNIYINGQSKASGALTGAIAANQEDLALGVRNTNSQGEFFDGTIDEVRISATARSADWIETSYNNQNNPSDFITLGSEETEAPSIPTVTTGPASLVEETTATINGTLTNDGGEECQYRFQYDFDASGEPYAYDTGWSTDNKTTGEVFSKALSSLQRGTKYYYRAQAKNTAGTGNGSELTFLTKPLEPSSFTATTASSSQINLSWTKGDGAQRTKIMRKEGSYPANVNDGDEVYFDTGESTSDTGLDPSTTYYYSAWSEVTGSTQWSDAPAQANATTTSGAPTVIGGLVLPVNKATVLAPWIFLGVVMSLAIAQTVFYFRKKRRLRTPLR